MLLTTKTVHIPAQPEIDADLNEFGHIGIKCRGTYGRAAIEAGAPDYPDGTDPDATITGAADAIANILHHVALEADDPDGAIADAIATALIHVNEERNA